MAMKKEIKVKVEFTEGYEKRYTEACLEQLRKRERSKQREEKAFDKEAIA